MTHENIERDMRYLSLLSQNFPTIADASAEIINFQAILNLPKGTEHFLADLHGEYKSFQHVLKNASGNIKRKVNEIFGNEIRESEKKELCTLIYYPEEKLELVKSQEEEIVDWYNITIHQLVRVCRNVSSKYTRSKVHKSLPVEFSYIIQELLHESTEDVNKAAYVNVIIETIITTGRADDFIIAMAHVIQTLAIDHLHILGDIYDRGPGAHLIMDLLEGYHTWDIQWGNHDILWMGACAGNDACICNVIRLSLRYGNHATIEEGYGINLVPLATFAMEQYAEDPCSAFMPRIDENTSEDDEKTIRLTAMMHKAITVLQLKVEAAIIRKHPEWGMDDRILLEKIDYLNGTCTIDGEAYKMKTCRFSTIDPNDPCKLTIEEKALMDKLRHSFTVNEKLHKHIRLLLRHGALYTIMNDNLLFHASVPLNRDGSLKDVELYGGKKYKGRELMDRVEQTIRSAFQYDSEQSEKDFAIDYFLYLWCGKDSILFDKSKMATFERYFLTDKKTFKEEKGSYFNLREDPKVCDAILDAYGVSGTNRHIINGHVPVHAASGENPIKAGGKLMVIDGGFAQAYHAETGIAGYTLVFHSRGFQLVQHEPFLGTENAILNGTDIK
ncbi:MAG: fructose-1,6-bisphosphatase, partial [Prevotella sp.]|nr:fructose-1,6-bisphosphatase [Prevotella sp.]